MKKTLLAAFLCIGIAAFAADDYKSLIKSAQKAEADRKTDQAIEAYTKASSCAAKPADRFYAVQKAVRLLIRAEKKNEAKKMLLNVAENPANPKIIRVQAYQNCVRAVKGNEEKLRLLDAGIALASGGWPEAACYNEKGAIFAAQKKYPEAVAVYKKVAEDERYPFISRTVSYIALASVAVQQQDYREAHRCYQCIREFSRKNPKIVFLDALKAEAGLYNLEKKYEQASEINFAIIKHPKASARDREKALEELFETEYNRRNDPVAAKKLLEKTATLKVKHTFRVRKIERDIHYLFNEED